jgi:hypothetical protein
LIYDSTSDYRPAFLVLALGPLLALPLVLSTRTDAPARQPSPAL